MMLQQKIKLFILSLTVTLVILAACNPTPSITIEDLSGTWQKTGVTTVFHYTEDGTYKITSHKNLLETDILVETGRFQLDGTSLTLIPGGGIGQCTGANHAGTYEVNVTEDQLQFIAIKDENCPERGDDLTSAPWTRISP